MKEIYFGTIDGDLLTNFEISKIIRICYGTRIDFDDLDEIRSYAENLKGITREIKYPSIFYLLRHGHKVRAVQIFHKRKPNLSLKECKESIDKLAEEFVYCKNSDGICAACDRYDTCKNGGL